MLKLDEAKQDSTKMTKENPRQLPKDPKMLKLDQAKQDPARMTNEEPHQLRRVAQGQMLMMDEAK